MLLCRSESELGLDIRKKIALFASLGTEAVISAKDVDNIYKVPIWYADQDVDGFIMEHFGLDAPEADLCEWRDITRRADEAEQPVRIAIVGKYVQLEDAYLSVSEALRHSGFLHGGRIEIDWVDSETLEDERDRARVLGNADGILVPGGFGGRGIEGKIRAVQVAREQRIPYLGICLGMQIAVLRVRPPRRRDGRRELDRVRHRDRVARDRPPARAEGGLGPRRDDAPRRRPDQAPRRHARPRRLRRGRRLRAPPAPL